MEDSHGFWPSDLENYLLLTASQYLLAQRDFDFLKQEISPQDARNASVGDLLWAAFCHIKNSTGVQAHGLITLLNVDHNDGLLSKLRPKNKTAAQVLICNSLAVVLTVNCIQLEGESVMNTALAVYTYDQYATVLDLVDQPTRAIEVRSQRDVLRRAVEAAWGNQSWYKRVYLGEVNGGWVGESELWTETQAWAILADAEPDRIPALIKTLDEQVRSPSPVGAVNANQYVHLCDFSYMYPAIKALGITPVFGGVEILPLYPRSGDTEHQTWRWTNGGKTCCRPTLTRTRMYGLASGLAQIPLTA